MTMQAGFEAMLSEADEWDVTAQALTTAAGRVAGLYLSTADFSAIASTTGVDASYEEARQFVVDVLNAGARETAQLADALRQIRADFQSTDTAVVEEVRSNWIPE